MKAIVPAILLSLSASQMAFAADSDLTKLIEAAKKKVKFIALGCLTHGQTGKAHGKIYRLNMV